jgi:CAAX prenyl protease-like protein
MKFSGAIGKTAGHPGVAYVAPFVTFVSFLLIDNHVPFAYPVRLIATAVILAAFSRKAISFRIRYPAGSCLIGIAVFLVWIFPDAAWPAYRQNWILQNSYTGRAASSIPLALRSDPLFLAFRILGTALIVPVIEELFWRGWLMRYLVSTDFLCVRLGAYSAFSFWLTAILFASEHGPYWDVGLVAGIAYNGWLVRTSSLGDCILAHAITNACLAAFVLGTGRFQFWL